MFECMTVKPPKRKPKDLRKILDLSAMFKAEVFIMAYRILVVDDEPKVISMLKSFLERAGYQVSCACDGPEAVEKAKALPDLILLDINMPGMDGLELCRAIRDTVSCPILFLTARISERDKIRGLQAGGDDYITKPFSLTELSARVAAHLRRDERARQSGRVIASHGLIVDLTGRRVLWEGEEIRFSRREFEVIEFLVMNQNQIFDRERMYELIWGLDAEGDSRVIKEHVRKIRNKLLEATGREFIETIWGMGYRWKR